jgi:hypothetical protein
MYLGTKSTLLCVAQEGANQPAANPKRSPPLMRKCLSKAFAGNRDISTLKPQSIAIEGT